jgi:glyoxylase-like metal-dependent hydrolase (beta-lactamase superfamily II)
LLAVALFFVPLTHAQEEGPPVSVEHVRGPLYLIHGGGGNVLASVGLDGILLVDDDYAEYAPSYQKAISDLTESDLAPSFILNTHWHADHTGSNEHWALQGAVIFAHNNVRQRMSSRQEIVALDRVVEASPEIALPVVTYADSVALHFNGSDIELQYYPGGHTDGDSVVYFSQDNVVHMGDLFFRDAFPFVDISSGGNVLSYIANVEAVMGRVDGDTIVIPGHGTIANKEDLQRFHQMLTTTLDSVKSSLQEGDTLQQIIARGLGEEWASWGGGVADEAAWIGFIADSL